MNKAPKCKLCGFQHWLAEPHVYARRLESAEDVQQVVPTATSEQAIDGQVKATANVAVAPAGSSPIVTKPVTKPTGRPRRYEINAARQKAYRERVKA